METGPEAESLLRGVLAVSTGSLMLAVALALGGCWLCAAEICETRMAVVRVRQWVKVLFFLGPLLFAVVSSTDILKARPTVSTWNGLVSHLAGPEFFFAVAVLAKVAFVLAVFVLLSFLSNFYKISRFGVGGAEVELKPNLLTAVASRSEKDFRFFSRTATRATNFVWSVKVEEDLAKLLSKCSDEKQLARRLRKLYRDTLCSMFGSGLRVRVFDPNGQAGRLNADQARCLERAYRTSRPIMFEESGNWGLVTMRFDSDSFDTAILVGARQADRYKIQPALNLACLLCAALVGLLNTVSARKAEDDGGESTGKTGAEGTQAAEQ